MSNTLQNASPVAESVVHIRTIVSGELEQETRALDREVLASAGREHLVWIDLVNPTRATLETLQEVYNLHPLAVREVSQRHRVSGASFFDEITHLVVQVPLVTGDTIGAQDLQIIIGEGFFISIHGSSVLDADGVLQQWRATSPDWRSTSSSLLYACYRVVLSAFGLLVEQLEDALSQLEKEAIDPENGGTPERHTLYNLFTVTEQITDLYNIASPVKDVMVSLENNSDWFSQEQANAWSRDVTDDARHLAKRLQMLQDTGQRLFDMVNTLITLQRADVADRLTLVATVFLPLTALGSFFGQNFQYLEEAIATREDFLLWGVTAPIVSLIIIFAVLQRVNNSV